MFEDTSKWTLFVENLASSFLVVLEAAVSGLTSILDYIPCL